MWVYRSMRFENQAAVGERRARRLGHSQPHRRGEPTGLSLGTVALQQSRLLFHPTKSV